MNTTLKPKIQRSNHRAVAPIIATLLMVAIAVVGGTIIFVFSQGFFSQSQISGTPTIESIKILGYDARDAPQLDAENDITIFTANSGGNGNGNAEVHERVAVYLKNDSVNSVQFAEILFGGTQYFYADCDALDAFGAASCINGVDGNGGTAPEFDVLRNTDGAVDTMLQEDAAELQPGGSATVLLALEGPFQTGRDTQFKLTTTNGAVFVGTISIGTQLG